MVKVYFFLKGGKTKANGEDPIFCKVTLGSKSFDLSTAKSISKERWDATMRLNVKLRSEKEKHTKQALEALQLKIEKCYYELSLLQEHVSLIDLRNKITGKEVTQNSTNLLLEVFKKHNEHFEKLVKSNERSAASLQKYKRSHDLVQNFLKAKYGLEDIEVEKVSSSMIYNLESYMKFESVFKDKVGIDNNSVVKYFSNFKSMCNYGIKMELIDKNPFVRYDGKVRVKEAVFLTQEELNGIEKLTLKTPRLERVRDIFLFSCYTGYAPIDACKLT